MDEGLHRLEFTWLEKIDDVIAAGLESEAAKHPDSARAA
jgi:hypothetical protein